MKRIIAPLVVAFGLAIPASASADITRSGSVFVAQPQVCSCVTTIDGYLFSGMPYYDSSPATDSAVELWWKLAADPNYTPLPPITSISTDTTVSGDVPDDGGRSYGTG
jgi:hypothetical protein